jgi:hypothetical protein
MTVRGFKLDMLSNVNGYYYVRTPNDEGGGAERNWADGLKATFAANIQQGSIRSGNKV